MAFDFNKKYDFFKNFLDKYKEIFRDFSTNGTLETQSKYISQRSEKISNSFSINQNKTILLAGKVQSGKTVAFTSIASRMFDKYTNIVILIGGNDKDLLKQNLRSLNDYFDFSKMANTVSIYDYKESDLENKIKEDLSNGKKIVIVILKNHQVLKNLSITLSNISGLCTPLIIDDEGDQASFPDVKKKKKNEYTATYKAIREMLEIFDNYNYLTVTATPYAHVMVSNDDDFIKPDQAFVWDAGYGYLGINFFTGSSDIENVIIPINQEDEDDVNCDQPIVVESMKQALCYFIVNATIFNLIYSDKKKFAHMLIHFDRKIKNMEILKEDIKFFINSTLFHSLNDSNSPNLKYMHEAIDKHNSYWTIVDNNSTDKQIDKNEIINYIKHKYADNFYIETIHQKNKGVILPTFNTGKLFNIYIGSHMVSRGVRFPNLITSYITRRNKTTANADYVLQMCRWFGYREQYKQLLNLFLSKSLEKDFYSINEGEEDFLDILQNLEEKNSSFKELENSMYFPQDHHDPKKSIIATRQTVAKQAIFNSNINNFFLSYSFRQTSYYQDMNIKIQKICIELIKLIKNKPFILNEHISKIDNYPSYLIKNIDELEKLFGSTYNDLNKVFEIDPNHNVKEIISNCINNGKKIVLSLMTKNVTDKINDFKFDNIHCRNRKLILNRIYGFNKGVTQTYVGDKYWWKQSSDYIFIQFHPIFIYNPIELNTGTDDNIVYKMLITSSDFIEESKNNNSNVNNVYSID